MSFSLIPQYSFRDITDITPDFLGSRGIKFLMLDLDNTIADYSESKPSKNVARWTKDVIGSGIELTIISNSVRKGRVEAFADSLGIGFVMRARKPSPKSVLQAIDAANHTACESALVGDQVFTDTIAANRAGIMSIIVRPRSFTNIFLALRYAIELPARALCRNKMN